MLLHAEIKNAVHYEFVQRLTYTGHMLWCEVYRTVILTTGDGRSLKSLFPHKRVCIGTCHATTDNVSFERGDCWHHGIRAEAPNFEALARAIENAYDWEKEENYSVGAFHIRYNPKVGYPHLISDMPQVGKVNVVFVVE